MKRSGIAELILHDGAAPRWLFERMVRLAKPIVSFIVLEYGEDEFLRRLADPFWFQALSCILGFDWHSSGTTTVTCSALKLALNPEEHRVVAAGGKGSFSLKTPEEIKQAGKVFGLSEDEVERLVYSSRMAAKVDNVAIQSGYPLYHHVMFLSGSGKWVVVQQGMNPTFKSARRYHWLSEQVRSFVEEPHTGIVGDIVHEHVLDMTAKESEDCRKVSLDIVKDNPSHIKSYFSADSMQKSLLDWIPERGGFKRLNMRISVNWDALKKAYESQPESYEQLLSIRGIGPGTVRVLALIAELVFGSQPSWKDPVTYSFAFGGKDGVPYPVDRRRMDEVTSFLERVIEEAKVGVKEKVELLKKLRRLSGSRL
ncbi:MAG: DUF763 domain-containing protein [Candidatus Freyarchaeota archaeon]|nr:DUF763 domain-containing protein [Candidatus Jordarchaeia archaeon]